MSVARKHLLIVCVGALTISAVTGCGGGGGNDSPQGLIWFTTPSGASTTQTAISVEGIAEMMDISAPLSDAPISWSSAGNSGVAARDMFREFPIGIPAYSWGATVPLALGDNAITVTFLDAKASIIVTRTQPPPDVTPPTINATMPASGATAVGTNSAYTVTFSEAMDPTTISNSTILLKDNLNNPVSGNVTYSNGVATFTPTASLLGLTLYTATITTGVKDVAGNALATAYGWSFTTGVAPDTTPPNVTSTSPANAATCVPTETQLNASFSEPVSSQTVNNNTFLLKDSLNNPVGGTVGYGLSGAYFAPNGLLSNASSYTGIITTGLTDLAGNHLVADYAWTFTTQVAGVGTWNVTPTTVAPSPRFGHTAVWTGTQMVVWGGQNWAINSYFGDGARYDPTTDAWTPLSMVGAPDARSGHVAIWTGSKMIIWGGVSTGAYLNSGAIYDPATDTWAVMSSSGAPSARTEATAVWTGTEMIVWGGYGGAGNEFLGDGARYNPDTNSWSAMAANGAPAARYGHTAIWNGTAMLVWGGGVANVGQLLTNTGGIYSPSSDSWTSIPTTGAPSARNFHVAVWSGSEMIVWGGYDGTTSLNTGARFNPSSSSWRSTTSGCAPLARIGHLGIWTGTELIVWGGASDSNGYYYKVGGRYDPGADSWQPTPSVGAPSARRGHTSIWTGTDMIVWGGVDVSLTSFNTGGRYQPQ
jgi:N-acetylneuraminic acid mutarotase